MARRSARGRAVPASGEQHQDGDNRGRLEIHRGPAPSMARKPAGNRSGARVRDQAVESGGAGPRAIRLNMFRLRLITEAQARRKNGAPAQSTTGVASANWNPARQAVRHNVVQAHVQHDDRQRQGKGDPEAPGHVRQLVVRLDVGVTTSGFQRHAADRATARSDFFGSAGASGRCRWRPARPAAMRRASDNGRGRR